MKILVLTPLYPENETQSVKETSFALHNFFKYWAQKEDTVIHVIKPVFLLRKKKLSYRSQSHFDNITVHGAGCLKIPKTEYWFSFGMVKSILIDIEKQGFFPDVIVCHMFGGLLMSRIIPDKIPLIMGLHNSDLKYQRAILKRKKRISSFVFRSEALKKLFGSSFMTNDFVAASGIDSELILSSDQIIEKQFHKPIRFIFVGLLQKLKNVDITLRALARIDPSLWTFTIVGEGKEKKPLMQLAENLKISHSVFFTGHKSHGDCQSLLMNSDVFIMVSAPETFGLVYLEALAKGLHVIGANGWGIDGVIINGENGFLCNPRDTNQLEKIIRQILDNKNRIEQKAIYETISSMTGINRSEAYFQHSRKIYELYT